MHIIIDLEQILINTKGLWAYRTNSYGRRHIINNLEELDTVEYKESDALKKVVKKYHNRSQITIITNQPEKESRLILRKHGYPQYIHMISNARKPLSDSFKTLLEQNSLRADEILHIGQTPSDVLGAHGVKIPTIVATWGSDFELDQLRKAEFHSRMTEPKDIEEAIILFEKGEIRYNPRRKIKYSFYRPMGELNENGCIKGLGEYTPYHNGSRMNELSKQILRFKSIKGITKKELEEGKTDDFFYNGSIVTGRTYKNVLDRFIYKIKDSIDKIPGISLVLAAPNSYPEFCYKTDVNQLLVKKVTAGTDLESNSRIVFRVYPKGESHNGYLRSDNEQHSTIGTLIKKEIPHVDNIIVFDDVVTSGSQVKTVWEILKQDGYKGHFYAICLGKTRSQ